MACILRGSCAHLVSLLWSVTNWLQLMGTVGVAHKTSQKWPAPADCRPPGVSSHTASSTSKGHTAASIGCGMKCSRVQDLAGICCNQNARWRWRRRRGCCAWFQHVGLGCLERNARFGVPIAVLLRRCGECLSGAQADRGSMGSARGGHFDTSIILLRS